MYWLFHSYNRKTSITIDGLDQGRWLVSMAAWGMPEERAWVSTFYCKTWVHLLWHSLCFAVSTVFYTSWRTERYLSSPRMEQVCKHNGTQASTWLMNSGCSGPKKGFQESLPLTGIQTMWQSPSWLTTKSRREHYGCTRAWHKAKPLRSQKRQLLPQILP